jgi:hypothetical protein
VVDGERIAAVVKLLRTHHACDGDMLTALVRTAKMRNMVAEANRPAIARPGTRRQALVGGVKFLTRLDKGPFRGSRSNTLHAIV